MCLPVFLKVETCGISFYDEIGNGRNRLYFKNSYIWLHLFNGFLNYFAKICNGNIPNVRVNGAACDGLGRGSRIQQNPTKAFGY